ncbi:hypothetical protein [Spirosoma gilvum]
MHTELIAVEEQDDSSYQEARELHQATIDRAIDEFIESTDKNAYAWLMYLFEGWMKSDEIEQTDSHMRAQFMRNFNSIVLLVQRLQAANEHRY